MKPSTKRAAIGLVVFLLGCILLFTSYSLSQGDVSPDAVKHVAAAVKYTPLEPSSFSHVSGLAAEHSLAHESQAAVVTALIIAFLVFTYRLCKRWLPTLKEMARKHRLKKLGEEYEVLNKKLK